MYHSTSIKNAFRRCLRMSFLYAKAQALQGAEPHQGLAPGPHGALRRAPGPHP